MKKERLFLLISIISILLLLLMTEFQQPLISGEVEKISGNYPLRIKLKDSNKEIILFERELALSGGSYVEIFGAEQTKGEILVNKITCLNC